MPDQRGPTVYVVQKPYRDIDLTPALDYGDLTYLLGRGQLSDDARQEERELEYHLRHFSDRDFLLLIGDPAAIALAGALAAKHNEGRFAMLKWDRHDEAYYPVFVDLSEQKGG